MKTETKHKIILFVQKLIRYTPVESFQRVNHPIPVTVDSRTISTIKWSYEIDVRKFENNLRSIPLIEQLKFNACSHMIKEAFKQNLVYFIIEDRRIPGLPILINARMDIVSPQSPIVADGILYPYNKSK